MKYAICMQYHERHTTNGKRLIKEVERMSPEGTSRYETQGRYQDFCVFRKTAHQLRSKENEAVSRAKIQYLRFNNSNLQIVQKERVSEETSKETAVVYAAQRTGDSYAPGDVVQMDAKYIWEDNLRKYQRTFIDIYTGIQFATVTSTMTSEDTVNAFLEAEKYFQFKILGGTN